MKRLPILFCLLLAIELNAQMGIGTLNPNPRSVLELKSTPGKGRGILIPRMTTSTRRGMEIGTDSVGVPLGTEHNSLLLFDNSQNLFYGYDNTNPIVTTPVNYDATGTIAEGARVWQIINPWKTQYAWDGFKIAVNLIQDTAATGFVGIGWVDYSESPTFPLHVKGDGYFDQGNLTVDRTIDAQTVKADTVGEHTKTLLQGFGSVPIGFVGMWSGNWDHNVEQELKEQGWVLCDGRTIDVPGAIRIGNAPDLRGKFMVGFDPDDKDYEFVGTEGPLYGDSAGVDRNNFYEFADNKKRVKLLEPSIPRHDHGASSLEHSHQIKFNTTYQHVITEGSGRGRRCSNNPPKYSTSLDILEVDSRQIVKTAGVSAIEGYCNFQPRGGGLGGVSSWRYYEIRQGTTYTGTTEPTTLNLDIVGGFTFPNTSPRRGITESAMAVENRPPFYTIAYIIRGK